MKKLLQNATSWSDTLTARKAHLNTLLKTIYATSAKMSQIQSLTIKAIKAELTYIESQLIRRK
ncbi:hypothetical protein ALQ93_01573 [Pseudomonas syringae pv. pisi]|uniref:Uncharacterized protein n=2 Tax=Pseudomonas syringae group TaxID=136849 RepID=A0A3M2XSS6_PSESJ|nr:hypothetical protein ALQ93_01573 [Pseudomonas syringae pv. pisi]RMU86740.1 hypothetical protein ALP21_200083 [Pseudomonas savastanoi pv. phaseolicola]RML66842.1 hypothetical protein ALQ92_02789 [Pseudomonas syringae pv. pisi]RMM24824.1 hypothetical protein ALQ82_03280 [Pseudomonas syringae pv. pisi]RMO22541.1 hypothetical protein ALQ44_00382 [Pseudomonas syringae pv. pisi]